ncbi:hypothetical protein Q7I27_09710 [Aeromonas veronii]|uniref:hypothetical protein n=1 Tax=Aeromonas veronii TaxID=654 RepID=UPI003003B780
MDKFNLLVDSTFNLLEASKTNQDSVDKTIKKLDQNIQLLDDNIKYLDKKIAITVKNHSEKYAEIISKEVISKLAAANESAEKAAQKYESAAKFSVLKLGSMFFLFFLLSGALLWLFFIKEIPTISEVNFLKEEKTFLEKEIYRLKEYGDLSSCGDEKKPCIKVDLSTKYGEDDNPYYIILPKE